MAALLPVRSVAPVKHILRRVSSSWPSRSRPRACLISLAVTHPLRSLTSHGSQRPQSKNLQPPELGPGGAPALRVFEWTFAQPGLMPDDLSPTQCHRAGLEFYAAMRRPVEGKASPQALLRDLQKHGVDAYVLHWTGLALLYDPMDAYRQMGRLMLSTGFHTGYVPSTAAVAVLKYLREDLQYLREDLQYLREDEPIPAGALVDSLRATAAAADDPDIWTALALAFMSHTNGKGSHVFTFVLKCTDNAMAAGARRKGMGPEDQTTLDPPRSGKALVPPHREPLFLLEEWCHYLRGLLLHSEGKTEAARAAYEIGALELQSPACCLELARLLPTDDPKREQYLIKASSGFGQKEACKLLSKHYQHQLAKGLWDDESLSSEEKKELVSLWEFCGKGNGVR